MIVRVSFTGIVKQDKKSSKLEDHADIHVNELKEAKELFLSWITKSIGIKGASGVFHPLAGWGDVKIKKVSEVMGSSTAKDKEETE